MKGTLRLHVCCCRGDVRLAQHCIVRRCVSQPSEFPRLPLHHPHLSMRCNDDMVRLPVEAVANTLKPYLHENHTSFIIGGIRWISVYYPSVKMMTRR